MKKILSIIFALVLCLCAFSGCKAPAENEELNTKFIYPLPETLDINALDNCTVAVSLENGDIYVDESGKIKMDAKVYTYELYDMVDIATLAENDVIVRRNEQVKVTEIERLETGLVRINGGEENGGFELISNDGTVYYEIGMSDIKAYYELGELTLPVADDFVYVDESDLESEAKEYTKEDLVTDVSETEYNFNQNNTSVVIKDGVVIEMHKVYMP